MTADNHYRRNLHEPQNFDQTHLGIRQENSVLEKLQVNMHCRTRVVGCVEKLRPISNRLDVGKSLFLGLSRAGIDLYSQGNPLHATASSLVLNSADELLMHHHAKLGVWLQPGGHIEQGEDPWDAAARELCEETGIVAAITSNDLLSVDAHWAGDHFHLDLRFLMRLAPGMGEIKSGSGFEWLTLEMSRERAPHISELFLDGMPKENKYDW